MSSILRGNLIPLLLLYRKCLFFLNSERLAGSDSSLHSKILVFVDRHHRHFERSQPLLLVSSILYNHQVGYRYFPNLSRPWCRLTRAANPGASLHMGSHCPRFCTYAPHRTGRIRPIPRFVGGYLPSSRYLGHKPGAMVHLKLYFLSFHVHNVKCDCYCLACHSDITRFCFLRNVLSAKRSFGRKFFILPSPGYSVPVNVPPINDIHLCVTVDQRHCRVLTPTNRHPQPAISILQGCDRSCILNGSNLSGHVTGELVLCRQGSTMSQMS